MRGSSRRVGRTAGLSLLVVASLRCAGGETEGAPTSGPQAPRTATLGQGSFTVAVTDAPLELSLRRGDTVLLSLPADAFELGTVTEVSDAFNYDPHPLTVGNVKAGPEGLVFNAPTRATLTGSTATEAHLKLSYPEGSASLTIAASAEGRFRVQLTPSSNRVAYFRIRPRTDKAEAFYGLGESFDDVNQRGKVRPMQIETGSPLESGYTLTHVPIPMVVGTRGWGLFVESPYPAVFDMASTEPDRVAAWFGTGAASTQGLLFHLFAADHPLDITRRYYDVTGNPRLPSRWALGPWLWRDENKDQAEVENDLNVMRDLALPHTGLWIDRPYATAVNSFDFKASQFPDKTKMIDLAHDLGFRMALWHTPYIDEKDPAAAALFAEAKQKGFYPRKVGLSLNKWGPLIDLTNPAAKAWWQDHLRLYTEHGIEGFKLDYGEDVVPGLSGVRNVWEFANGSDERTMHSQFQTHYHSTYQELLPEDGGFLLCRHATYGDQKNLTVIWPGDLDATFDKNGDAVNDGKEKYVAVGGLPASIVAGLSLGPSGFPFYGADTGGYIHSEPNKAPDKELFSRWFEQTALSTVMQIGNSGSTAAWDKGVGFDDEMLGWYRTYTRLHLRLFPYVWTYAKGIEKDGRPIARALGLAYPELGEHPNDTYLFGDHLLVAPVLVRGQREREVLLPPGEWVHWWTGESFMGGRKVTVAAPLEQLPLFLRRGGIVPLLRPTIDAMAPTTQPSRVDSYATTPGLLWPRIAVGSAGATFTLFDGSEIRAEKIGTGFTLSSKDGAEFKSGVVFEVIAMGAKPLSVVSGGSGLPAVTAEDQLAGMPSGFFYDAGVGGRLLVKVGPGASTVTIL